VVTAKKKDSEKEKSATQTTTAASASGRTAAAVGSGAAKEEKDAPSVAHAHSLSFSSHPFPGDESSEYDTETEHVKILKQGAFFNEISLLKRVPREFTVTAREPTVLFTLTKEKFLQFLKVAPEVKTALNNLYPGELDDVFPESSTLAAKRTATSSRLGSPVSSQRGPIVSLGLDSVRGNDPALLSAASATSYAAAAPSAAAPTAAAAASSSGMQSERKTEERSSRESMSSMPLLHPDPESSDS
jgi:hypothetical protein